jgi:hypothetical protein
MHCIKLIFYYIYNLPLDIIKVGIEAAGYGYRQNGGLLSLNPKQTILIVILSILAKITVIITILVKITRKYMFIGLIAY